MPEEEVVEGEGTPEEKLVKAEAELEELRPLKDSSEKAKTEFEEKEKAWEQEKEELEKAANPNWKKTRGQLDAYKAALKEKGVETDEEGNIISKPPDIDVDEIVKKAQSAARDEILGGRLEQLLDQYEEEAGKLVRVKFEKLTAGETVTLKNINEFINQAEAAAEAESGNKINKVNLAAAESGGQGPRTPGTEEVLDDASALDLADKLGIKIKAEEQK